ncbi:protein of unknown function [Nitrospira japonica]|uniref:Uncharacterized protein n=1 Tax=Nitrospira japonica TaxID=1325564 RepID=A0A1W1IA11_9BACT|nr:protein of unknown function [Nitrospira japonica]
MTSTALVTCLTGTSVFVALTMTSGASRTVDRSTGILSGGAAAGSPAWSGTGDSAEIGPAPWPGIGASSAEAAWRGTKMPSANTSARNPNETEHGDMRTSLWLEGCYFLRQLGLLTHGSTFPCAFPWNDVHSGVAAGSLPVYSGGTVMDSHHLPRR